MTTGTPMVSVAVIDGDACWVGTHAEDVALTLIAVASEDPACWDEIAAYWPRYRSPQVPEFADGLSLRSVPRADAIEKLSGDDAWVVIDLVEKRIVTGEKFQQVERIACFAMDEDEKGNQHCPMMVHLPAWWELAEQTQLDVARRPRQAPIDVPRVNRQVLFGQPMIQDLVTRIVDTIGSQAWQSSDAANDSSARYDFTKAVHRDWLMTPRDDLDGKMPREMLHGGRDWIERLSWGQRLRFDDGLPIIAAPDQVEGFETAPMGLEEMVMYFDLVRELVSAGWFWCTQEQAGRRSIGEEPCDLTIEKLIAFLTEVKNDWLTSPFEGGSPPRFIIECSRRRVPRGAGVQIVGIDGRQAEAHVSDCDCPICEMMADGLFGVGFCSIDGHHLELDSEFAFSTCATREEWDKQQREYAEFSAAMDRKQAKREAADDTEPDEFASAWSSPMSQEPLPGDPLGHMNLAFLLAELISELEKADAPNEQIKALNVRFREFRMCESDELATTGQRLGEHLENLSQQYPDLTSRVADFRSRIDAQVRESVVD